MNHILAQRTADKHVCGGCSGNLVVMCNKDGYYLRCVNNCDLAAVGMAKPPVSNREQVMRDEWSISKIKRNLKGENFMGDTTLTTIEQRESDKFTVALISQLQGASTSLDLTEHQKRLAKRLWLHCDQTLRDLETKRQQNKYKQDNAPITWENVDRNQLAIDAWKRIDLGLDALIPNHIHPIPYWNSTKKQYDLNLQIGYAGKDYYRRQAATEKPLSVQYELVYDTDTFIPIMSSQGEKYEFKINKPFSRGSVIGGFGYIQFNDPRKNKLVVVSNADFEAAHKASKSKGENDFYENHPLQMKMVVIVRKTTKELQIDPRKISEAYREAEKEDIESTTVIEAQYRDISDAVEIPASVAEKPAVAPETPQDEDIPSEPLPNPFPKLSAKYGDLLDGCTIHGDAWSISKFKKRTHKTEDGWCNFSEILKPITEEICTGAGIEDGLALNEKVKKEYDGRTWSKLSEEEQLTVLEGLI